MEINGLSELNNKDNNIHAKAKNDYLNLQKLNIQTNKFRLLKPKIDASNGGYPNIYSGHLNNLHLNVNLKKLQLNNINQTPKPVYLLKNDNFKCEDILKYPKFKNFKKLKEAAGNNLNNVNNVSNTNNNSFKIINPHNQTELLNSTNITNITDNHNTTTQKETSFNETNKMGNNSTTIKRSNTSSSKAYKKVSNYHNLKTMKTINTNSTIEKANSSNTLNKHYNNRTIQDMSMENSENDRNTNHMRNNSVNIRNTKTLINESLSLNLQQLANHLQHNKSLNHRKSEKIEILKNMVDGLTKLTTIMMDESDNENEIAQNINNENYFHDNKMLISSTTGEMIKCENKKIFNLMKNNTITKKTIDQNEENNSTIRDEEEPLYDPTSNINNNSLIMQIRTEERTKNTLIANRYSNSSLFKKYMKRDSKSFIGNITDSNLESNLLCNDNSYNTRLTNTKTPTNMKLKINPHLNDNSNYILNNTTICNSKDFIFVNKNSVTPKISANVSNNKKVYKIDKFEVNLNNNKKNTPLKITHENNNFNNNVLINADKSKANKRILTRKFRDTIDNEDFLTNYEFVD
jgi:hypothetical protein